MKKIMNVLLAICIILSMSSGVTVYAEVNSGGGQAGEIEIIDSSMASEYLEIMQNEITIDNNKSKLNVSNKIHSRAVSLMPDDPVGVINGELSASDNNEMHFFSVTKNALLLLGLTSTNANYYVQLYIIDYTTGQATPTNITITAGNVTALNGLPTGDYMFYVGSTSTVGDEYSLMINTENASGNLTIEYVGPTLENTMIYYANGDLYANGKLAFNCIDPDLSAFEWTRVFQLNYPGGGYHARVHGISDVKIKSIDLTPITYSSNYTSSTYAIRIYLDEGTLFTYRDSVYENGGPLVSTMVDTTGKTTPRRLDSDDIGNMLIFSMNEMQSIDLYGNLNYYYYNNIESATITNKAD